MFCVCIEAVKLRIIFKGLIFDASTPLDFTLNRNSPENRDCCYYILCVRYLTGTLNSTSSGGRHCLSLQTINSTLPLTTVVALLSFIFC